jgi:hypothetical protein
MPRFILVPIVASLLALPIDSANRPPDRSVHQLQGALTGAPLSVTGAPLSARDSVKSIE